jgi:hypothetical protein
MTIFRSNIPLAYSNLMINAFWNSEFGDDELYEYKQFYDIYKSNKAFEQDVGYTGFAAAPRKEEGAPFAYDNATQTYSTIYRNYTYGLGYQVTQEAREDAVGKELIAKMTSILKRSFYTTINTVCANVLNEAFTTNSLNPTGDGVPLVANNHPTRAGNQSNVLATPADLSYTSLQTLITQVMQTKSDRNNPTPLKAKKLIIPTNYWNVATSILKTAGAPGTGNNDTNAILAYGGLFTDGMCVNHYLTDTNAFYVKTNAMDGFKYFDRVPIEINVVPPEVSVSGDIQVRGRVRFSSNVSNWRAVFATAGSS